MELLEPFLGQTAQLDWSGAHQPSYAVLLLAALSRVSRAQFTRFPRALFSFPARSQLFVSLSALPRPAPHRKLDHLSVGLIR